MATKKHLAYLFPCALVEDFSFGQLASTITTEEQNKWSTENNGTMAISLDEQYTHEGRTSLKIDVETPTNDKAILGVTGTDFDHTTVNNPFGSAEDDFSVFDNMGMWIYSTNYVQSDDADMISVGYYGDGGNDSTTWNSSIDTADKWQWFDDAVDFQYTDVERVFINGNRASAGGDVYCNILTAFKRSTSNRAVATDSADNGTTSATGLYDWKNGLSFISTGLTDNLGSYALSGVLDPENWRESLEQLKSMTTIGLHTHSPLKKPHLKYSTIKDELKTYLFMEYTKGPEDSSAVITKCVPVILTDLSISHTSGRPNIVRFSVTLNKFAGV